MKKLLFSTILIFSLCFVQTSSAATLDLVLLIDGSGSIGTEDFQLQLNGYKNTFASGSFYDDYIDPSPYTAIRVSAFQFSDTVVEEIDWTLIEDNNDATNFGNMFTTTNFTYLNNYTNTSAAINAAITKIDDSTNDRVIDISTDGEPYSSNGPEPARTNALVSADNARAAGIKVNAIGIGGVDTTFLKELVGLDPLDTPTGFFVTADSFNDFESAIQVKLGREITGTSPVPEPATMLFFGFGLISFAGILRAK